LFPRLGRFKDKFSGSTNDTINTTRAEIDSLRHLVAENHKIADIVLLEVKAVFLKNTALLQSAPQPIPEEKHRHPKHAKSWWQQLVGNHLGMITSSQPNRHLKSNLGSPSRTRQ